MSRGRAGMFLVLLCTVAAGIAGGAAGSGMWAAGWQTAWAHPFTDETVPAQGTSAAVGTSQVIVFYSEQVELDFSSLKVFDGDGKQVDNRDTAYHVDEKSLVVTTPPLEEGVYTVASKVLSKVDGHLVPDAFVFGVGGAEVAGGGVLEVTDGGGAAELIYYPEAAARFPGLVGQTMVLGAAIASVFVLRGGGGGGGWWWVRGVGRGAGNGVEAALHRRFLAVTGAGIVTVIASNILMLAIQTARLEASAADVLGATSFGAVWMARMAVTGMLLGTWFWLEKTGRTSGRSRIPMLAVSLVLISTTTLIGHGAASEQAGAVVLDYVHNLVAGAWIGGVIFFAFAVLPSLSGMREGVAGDGWREAADRSAAAAIPRFSVVAVACLGVVIVSGPLLMWFLEDDVGVILQSTYGKLVIAKLVIAAGMVGMGGYHQFCVQRGRSLWGRSVGGGGKGEVRKRLRRSLGVESVLGVVLLGVVALLANGTLPAGEVRADVAVEEEMRRGVVLTEFAGDVRFVVDVYPFARGANTIGVMVDDAGGGGPVSDLESVKVKVSNPERGIFPIEIGMQPGAGEGGAFEGVATFGFSGRWLVEVEALRTGAASEAVSLDLWVKPRLADLHTEFEEYEIPGGGAKPLYPVYDAGRESIWVGDTAGPAVWRFSIDDESFERFEFEGGAAAALAMDDDGGGGGGGGVWFTDIPGEGIGRLDPETGEVRVVGLPEIGENAAARSVPVSLAVDGDGRVWTAVVTKGVVARYDPETGGFETFELADRRGAPFAVMYDEGRGVVWYSESASGRIGTIDPGTGEMTVVVDELDGGSLASPEALALDDSGGVWVTEHSGSGIARYDPVLGTVERVPVDSPGSLPFGMAFDRYGNLWFAQHQIDSLGVYDPYNGDMMEVAIPTEGSFVQFITADGGGNIWVAEPGGGKIGVVRVSEGAPPPQGLPDRGGEALLEAGGGWATVGYAELAGPLMAAGIVATSLFFVKGVRDCRRMAGGGGGIGPSAGTSAADQAHPSQPQGDRKDGHRN